MNKYQYSIGRRGSKWTVGLKIVEAKTRVEAKKKAMKYIKSMNKPGQSTVYVLRSIWRKQD